MPQADHAAVDVDRGGSLGDMPLSSGIRLGCAWVMVRNDQL